MVESTTVDTALRARVEAALDKIRPAIRADGGDVWLIRIEGAVAYVQMLGACGGCAAAMSTLKGGIEAVVTSEVTEITAVEHI
jgi:Fe-S cluster biogenesis protein NfuA